MSAWARRLAVPVTTNVEGGHGRYPGSRLGYQTAGGNEPRRGEDTSLPLWSIQFAVLHVIGTVGWSAELAAGGVIVPALMSVLIVYSTGFNR
ncbi:MAG: hypothetical protein NVS4B6_29640 [Mycobacterium sp.]